MYRFTAKLEIIGINPFVFVPEKILQKIFLAAAKQKGHIPVCGTINGDEYKQTLVRYSNDWRLYINTTMLKASPKRIGEKISVTIGYDGEDRTIPMHPGLEAALLANKKAKKIFDSLPPSRKKEIIRYIANLKTETTREMNINKAISFLQGENRFAGRDKP